MNKFWQALATLLPTGYAWPRDPDSTLMRVLLGVALAFDELDQFISLTMQQWLPHTTCSRLAEWEEALGLPDPCIGPVSDEALRRQLVAQRLRGPVLAYADSSPAAVGAIVRLCTDFGYVANVFYEKVFRIDRDGMDDRLGAPGYLVVDMSSMCDAFRVEVNGMDDYMVTCSRDPSILLCLLKRMVPARYALNFIVDGDFVAA